jgi:flagellar basal body-associated protein FliL
MKPEEKWPGSTNTPSTERPMYPEEETEQRPQKRNHTFEVILTVLAVAVAVVVIGGAVWHYETTSDGPCYSQFGGIVQCSEP